MLGSIYIGLSGLDAYSRGLQTISNNVANINSPGYKSTVASFTDVFNYGGGGLTFSGGTDSQHAGGGVVASDTQIDFTQGDLRQSTSDLDLAIQGNGFLLLQNGSKTVYARTGQFAVDKAGYITLAGTDSHLTTLNDAGHAAAVNIDSKRTSSPVATTTIKFADNLSSSATNAKVSDVAVYDSQGVKQTWQVKFDAVAGTSPQEWTVTVTDQNGRSVGTSTLKFSGGAVDPSTAKLTINDTPAGAAPLAVVLDFSTGVTSFSGGTASTLRAASSDGNAVGTLTKVAINADGKVELTYSNSKTDVLGAVALADFRDPQALTRVGNGTFENRNSATGRVLASGTDGVGTLVSRQVEASNVNLSDQFGELILIQRGFQASSQVVSIANDLIQTLFGIRGQ